MGHIHDKIDFTASAYIVHKDKILLLHHKKLDIWMQVGGHIELDEDPDTTIFREIKEESGLEVEILSDKPKIPDTEPHKALYRPDGAAWFKYGDLDHYHVDLIYYCRAISDNVTLEEEGAHDIRWFSIDDLDNPVYKIESIVKYHAREALKRAAQ
jgi:8-oxo-dGTP diphosphatase